MHAHNDSSHPEVRRADATEVSRPLVHLRMIESAFSKHVDVRACIPVRQRTS